jgi:hypothetical protein
LLVVIGMREDGNAQALRYWDGVPVQNNTSSDGEWANSSTNLLCGLLATAPVIGQTVRHIELLLGAELQ